MTSRAFLGLGGNLGDPAQAMRDAIAALDQNEAVEIIGASSVYSTPPWGMLDQPDFLNAVVELRTDLAPLELLKICLNTETELKRVRNERWGPRVIDVDVLWYDGKTINEPGLHVPHPRMEDRAFVMVPLAEIAPDLPLDGGNALEVAQRLDQSGISLIAPPSDLFALKQD